MTDTGWNERGNYIFGGTDFFLSKGIRVQTVQKNSCELKSKSAAIAALAGEIWREHFPPIIGEVQTDYMLAKFQSADRIYADVKSGGYTYFTAECVKHDEMIGYCAIRPEKDYLFLSKLYIRKDFRGRGIARGFLDEVSALCRQEYGFDKIRLTVNKNNDGTIKVYLKMGFETVDSTKTDIGEGFFMDDYVMELRGTCKNPKIA